MYPNKATDPAAKPAAKKGATFLRRAAIILFKPRMVKAAKVLNLQMEESRAKTKPARHAKELLLNIYKYSYYAKVSLTMKTKTCGHKSLTAAAKNEWGLKWVAEMKKSKVKPLVH